MKTLAALVTVIAAPAAIVLLVVGVYRKTYQQTLFRLRHAKYTRLLDFGHDLNCAQKSAFERSECTCDKLRDLENPQHQENSSEKENDNL